MCHGIKRIMEICNQKVGEIDASKQSRQRSYIQTIEPYLHCSPTWIPFVLFKHSQSVPHQWPMASIATRTECTTVSMSANPPSSPTFFTASIPFGSHVASALAVTLAAFCHASSRLLMSFACPSQSPTLSNESLYLTISGPRRQKSIYSQNDVNTGTVL